MISDNDLKKLQRDTFGYFLHEANSMNGLIPDNTRQDAPSSIAAVGLALATYPIAVERGFISRTEAISRTLTTLRFFWNERESTEAIGYQGFFYHFLDMKTGQRVWESELSTIDSAYFLAGALATAAYFADDTPQERELRELAEALYRNANWQWALNGGQTVTHGWQPESGFLPYRWEGYSEALLLYILGLGSPTYPLPVESYKAWTKTYAWTNLYGYDLLDSGPLFTHQLSHVWLDFRGIQDEFMRTKGLDYFENSRRATYVQRAYTTENPLEFKGYAENCWGITASDGPGDITLVVDGRKRQFFDYCARAIYKPDDGTLAPWAVVASLPFAPEIVLSALAHINQVYPHITSKYGFKCSFNPTFPAEAGVEQGWISQGYYGIDQGPVVLMIENHLTGFFWDLFKQCPYVVEGLRRAGFQNGWLDK